MDFEAELKVLLAKAEAAGLHGLEIARHLAEQAAEAVRTEAEIVRRHNPQLFAPTDAKGG